MVPTSTINSAMVATFRPVKANTQGRESVPIAARWPARYDPASNRDKADELILTLAPGRAACLAAVHDDGLHPTIDSTTLRAGGATTFWMTGAAGKAVLDRAGIIEQADDGIYDAFSRRV